MKRALTLAGLIVVGAIVACQSPEEPPREEPSRRPNVVLIGVDTLRADHLGCYGYARPTSPRIDAFAAESAVFRQAIASSPWTLPSFASMLTGLVPSHHRAGEGRPDSRSGLDTRFPTLASILQAQGYATGSFVSNGWVSTRVGLARGFAEHTLFMRSEQAAQAAVRFVDAHADQPFFAFVHLLAPHAPYEPPPEDAALFIDPAYDGPVGTRFDVMEKAETDADRRRVVDLYDGEIRLTDRLIGSILDALSARGLTERTMIVVTADHGEELLDHGARGHGHTLYQELLHVPLLVRFLHAQFRGQVTRRVRTLDLMPTILDTLGIAPPAGLDAVSLVPLLRGEPMPAESERAFAEFVSTPGEQKAVLLGHEKLVLTQWSGATALFDLTNDPREHEDRSAAMPERAAALAAIIQNTLVAPATGAYVIVQNLRSGDVVKLTVTTPGTFEEIATSHTESDDRVTVAPDRPLVELELHGSDPKRDSDGVHLRPARTHPAVAITSASLNGEPFPPDRVFAGETFQRMYLHPPPWTFLEQPTTAAKVAWLPEPRKEDACRIVVTFVPPPPTIEMDEALRRHLRELGYLE